MKNPIKNPIKKRKKRSKKFGYKQFTNQIVATFLILLVVGALYSLVSETAVEKEEISFSEFVTLAREGAVSSVAINNDSLEVTLEDESIKKTKKETESSLSESLTNYGLTPEQIAGLNIDVKSGTGLAFWLLNILPIALPILFIIFFFWFISRQVKGASMQAFSFGQSKARVVDPSDNKEKITFKDVAGVKEAKEELLEIVDFLKNPKKFIDIGAKIPKGVLLMGAPGTGKTLLARAVAGEADVPFIYLSGSEFVEMFVGVGASRVRDLFAMAKKASPAIIFIDEIDAIGRHRGAGMGGGNDEREQTLNQILVEMDGFEPHEKIIVLAATNRPDVLDPALLRPGRFDRRVMLDAPDIKDREAILKIHAKKKPLAPDVDFAVMAQRTPGFTGADLANAVNEAAILTARENRKQISQYDLLRSVEKVMLGPERKSHILSTVEKKITAYHEMGHALIASVLPHSDPVHKVSIISRGHAAGYTLKLPDEDKKLQSRAEFLDDIAVSLGGYAAEMMIFGDVTTGASNDIQVSTALARSMVTKYGMSDELGPIAFEKTSGGLMTGRGEVVGGPSSEAVAAKVDTEVSRIMTEGLARAKEALETNRGALDQMSEELIKVETLERAEFEKLLILNGIRPKAKNHEPKPVSSQ